MQFLILYEQGVMTLGEMIEKLNKLDQSLPVRITYPVDDPKDIENKRLLVKLSFEQIK